MFLKNTHKLLFFLLIILTPTTAFSSSLVEYCKYGLTHNDKLAQKSLTICGRTLDALNDKFTEAAEKDCYWRRGAPKTPMCMKQWTNKYNNEFGAGSFVYRPSITSIQYTAMHYKMLLKKFKRSKYRAEAEFAILLRQIIGHPDIVLPKIKKYLKENKRGDWHRKGLLLWARVNEDIWYVHRKWSWVLYNNAVDESEMIVRSEPYRQEALKTYKKLMKKKKTFEGQAAAREYSMLKSQKDDGALYSIVNDSFAGPLSRWGIFPPSDVKVNTK